ncbi:MAG: allophanate hydrolase subunit 1 [Gemmataceae bacterium]
MRGQPIDLEHLGDQAILARFRTEAEAACWARSLSARRPEWITDIVPAYTTVAVFYDALRIVGQQALQALRGHRGQARPAPGQLHWVPCCYERGPDLPRVAQLTGLSVPDIVRLHQAQEFYVYAIGFVPGFPYLGYLPEVFGVVRRLERPRVRVPAGSVGIAGRQTGIYPAATPGGWHLIGQTPLVIADLQRDFFPIRAGDRVRFVAIGEKEFARWEGQQLGAYQPPNAPRLGP